MYDQLEQPTPAPVAVAKRSYPPASWPSAAQLDYTQKLITVVLLTLALPWLAYKLWTDPRGLIAGAGRQHVKVPS